MCAVCGVCECWQRRLHRFACLPLASLFTAEIEAEQGNVEGSKRGRKQSGRRKNDQDDDASDDDEDVVDVDRFDALDL